jgi:hypothetical protein
MLSVRTGVLAWRATRCQEMTGGSITPQQSAFPSHFEDMQSAEKLLLISGPPTPASILETIVIGITQKI